MEYQNHFAIQFALYCPYLTRKQKQEILLKKHKKAIYDLAYKEGYYVSISNQNEMKHKYKDKGLYGNPKKKRYCL